MRVDLPEELIKKVAAEAILTAINQEQRDTLIRNAVAYLLTPDDKGYGRRESPITSAFNDGIRAVASRLAVEMFEKDETVKNRINELLTEALEKMMGENRAKTVDRIASALTEGMAYRDR
jgi:hypothetical protein